MSRNVPWFALPALIALGVGCQTSGPNTHAGAAIGGLSGAAIGAIAGADEGKSLQGAAIGATAGGLLGGALGNQIDSDIARDDAIRQANYNEAAARAVSVETVNEMAANGLSDPVIIAQVRANGMLRPLTTQDLIELKQRGVSDAVINAMQQAPVVSATPRIAAAPVPVIVEEPWCEPAPIYFFRPRRHHHCPPGVSWHIAF